jgi:hypothetical protein
MIAHTHGQLYGYEFQIYRDLGPQFEMAFVRTETATGESSLPEFLPINEYRRQRHAPRHRWWQILSSHKPGGTIA